MYISCTIRFCQCTSEPNSFTVFGAYEITQKCKALGEFLHINVEDCVIQWWKAKALYSEDKIVLGFAFYFPFNTVIYLLH